MPSCCYSHLQLLLALSGTVCHHFRFTRTWHHTSPASKPSVDSCGLLAQGSWTNRSLLGAASCFSGLVALHFVTDYC